MKPLTLLLLLSPNTVFAAEVLHSPLICAYRGAALSETESEVTMQETPEGVLNFTYYKGPVEVTDEGTAVRYEVKTLRGFERLDLDKEPGADGLFGAVIRSEDALFTFAIRCENFANRRVVRESESFLDREPNPDTNDANSARDCGGPARQLGATLVRSHPVFMRDHSKITVETQAYECL